MASVERYPAYHLVISNLMLIASYASGAAILFLIGVWPFAVYLSLVLLSLLAALWFRCRLCYYHGRRCFSGMGGISGILFRRGEGSEFPKKRNLIPAAALVFVTMFAPIVGGMILLLIDFSWLGLTLLLAYLVVGVAPGFAIRKNIYCPRCRQGKIACPAYEGMKGESRRRVP